MSFFSRINEDATIERAKDMLDDYRVYKVLSKRVQFPSLQSPTITDMPTERAYGNTNENKIIKYLSKREEAQLYCSVCIRSIEALESDIYRKILTDTYIMPVAQDALIWTDLGYERRRYYELKREALLAYSEVCPGIPTIDKEGVARCHEILVYKTSKDYECTSGAPLMH